MRVGVGRMILSSGSGPCASLPAAAYPILVLLAGALPAAAAEPLLGSPAFRPSPERPVGWRGDGSGCFPGATPPIHFSDGTVLSDAPQWVFRSDKGVRKAARRDPGKERSIRWKTSIASHKFCP